MRKVLKFVKGKLEEKKEHGSSIRSLGVLGELPSPVDQGTPTEETYPGFVQGFGYNIDLSGKDKSITKLHKAAWLGNLDKVKVNLKKTDVDAVDRLSRSSLHLSAAQGHASVVWFLLNNGANMNIYDSEGKTPFLKAIECGHKEAINLMLERGVDINTVDFNGNTGLHIAAKQGFYEIATMLLKQGANFECANSYGEFPLHIATVAEYKDLVELLLRYGSSVNIVDRDNRSPLMFAAKAGNMALVQLFLEYGAQRAVMDSNDWTAEDYALMAGHQDIAAELKSPSDRVAMAFTEQQQPAAAVASKLPSHKRSVSIASLPVTQSKKEKTMEIQAEEGDNSDTWNDSQMSDSSSKPKGKVMKLSKFLPPSDDEISEESIQSPRVKEVKEDEMQDSPRSCVIPPPCKPPRSWDLIQSGVIDDPKTLEPRRRSLLPLGSLRSRRESFNESPNGADSASLNSDNAGSLRKVEDKPRQHIPLMTSDENEASSSTKYEEIAHTKEEGAKQHKEEDVKSSSSDSDWDSDNSLPMDNYLPPISPTNDKGNQSFSLSTEKRNRFLMRAPSIDLTDDDAAEAGKDKRLRSPNAPGVEPQDKALSVSGTLGREGTLLGYEEMWEANAHLSAPTSAIEDIKEETENVKDDGDILLFHSPTIEHKVKGYESCARSVDEVGKGERYKLESRSLDTLEPAAKVLHSKRHTRQQSMSIHTWSQSEELHDKPLPPPPPPMTAELDHMIEENKRINAQLRCYDEALRELAHVSMRKQGSLSLPRTQESSCLIRSQSAGARSEGLFSLPSASEMAQSAIVRKQGSLSLPRTSEIPDFAMMQSLGSKKHSSASEFAMREMAQTAIVKRQGSLSLPKTCEMPDLTVASGEEYLSLPRSNQLIDEAFKEIGNSTATMKKRGSRSLPRTIDAKAISLGADPTPPSRHRKLRNRRRAESESEAFNRKLEEADAPSKSLSFEKSLKVSETEETDASIVKLSPKEPGSKSQVTDSQVDKPIRKKRKMLLAMRGFVAPALKHMNGSSVSQISTEESVEEPPFWMSTDREGGLARQSTVIERPVIEKESSPVADIAEESIGLQEEAARDSGEQSSQASSQKKETDVQSDDAESGLSQSDNTPQHLYALKSHHLLLKQHLQRATSEKSHLEEIAAMLGEETQKLKYELAEAREAARSRDEVIAVLESQVARMETLYTSSLEESQKYKLRLGNLEQELQHVKDVCTKLEEEKVHLNEIIELKDMEKSTKDEQTRLQAMVEEKELEKKQQVLQVHLTYLEAEKTKQAEMIAKLEEKNAELEARLDKVTAINQSLAEEKTLLNEKNVTDCKLIEEKSEKWKELYESCMDKLEDVSVCLAEIKQEEAHATKVASEEKEKLKQDLRDIIEKIEDTRLKGSEDWQNKLHEEITSAIHLLGVEYSRLETSLVKHSKKLEMLMDRLLGFIQSSEQRPSTEEKCIIHEAVTLVEQLKHLNLEHQQQLQEQQAELKRTVNDTWFEHNRELNEENKQLKKDLADFQNKSMQGTRELLEQLKCENTALREQIEQLVEQVRESKEDEKEEITREIWNKLQQENNKLEEQLELLQEKLAMCTEVDCEELGENEVLLANMEDKLRKITEENDKLMKENKNLQQVVQGAQVNMTPCGDNVTRTAQTMTDPDMEIMHLTMENASLHSQLQQLSEDFAEKELELQMAKMMHRQDEMDALVCENCSLKKELEEVQLQAQLLHKLKTENAQLKAHLRRFLSKDQEKEGHARFATWLAMDNEMLNGKASVETTNTDSGTIIINLAKPSLQRMTSKSKSEVECINLYGPPSNFESLDSQSGLVMELGAKTLEQVNGESAQYQPPVETGPEQQNGESAAKNGRVSRDAATNTASLAQTFELQRELQLEKERCKKYQQNVKKLKSDIQILKNKLGENRKAGKQDSNLVVKQNNTNAMLSPSRDDGSLSHFQKQIAELEQKVREENSLRFTLEVQINKMRYELQEKLQLEQELGVLRNRLERDFVSRYELEQLKNSYEMALSRAKYDAEMEARDDLNEKLCHINSFIEKQVQEQMRNTTEVQMKQDFQDTQLKLLSELAKVQATLQTKGEQEKELREKCEKLTRECEKKQEIKRKKLIEKSYSVNLAPSCANREKEISTKFLDMRASSLGQAPKSPVSSPPVATVTAEQWPSDHPFSHILRRELERSIRKHTRTDSLSEQPSSSVGQSKSDEQLQVLKKKYFLH